MFLFLVALNFFTLKVIARAAFRVHSFCVIGTSQGARGVGLPPSAPLVCKKEEVRQCVFLPMPLIFKAPETEPRTSFLFWTSAPPTFCVGPAERLQVRPSFEDPDLPSPGARRPVGGRESEPRGAKRRERVYEKWVRSLFYLQKFHVHTPVLPLARGRLARLLGRASLTSNPHPIPNRQLTHTITPLDLRLEPLDPHPPRAWLTLPSLPLPALDRVRRRPRARCRHARAGSGGGGGPVGTPAGRPPRPRPDQEPADEPVAVAAGFPSSGIHRGKRGGGAANPRVGVVDEFTSPFAGNPLLLNI